jgi:hypothetical protein
MVMKRLLSIYVLFWIAAALYAETIWTEGFEDSFPPPGWATNSVEQSTTYAFNGATSVRLNATGDYLITPPVSNAQTLIFWSYTTAADPQIVVEFAPDADGPWTPAAESPFYGYTEQWNGQWIAIPSTESTYFRFRKTGSGTLYLDEISVEDGIAVSNRPPVLAPVGDRTVFEMGTIVFSASAEDQVDHDEIALTATGLPPGAVFTNGLFTWSHAVPVGIYPVTFTASDKDGGTNETVIITVIERPKLLISEIADPAGTGGGDYRFVELYNAGSNTIDLAAGNWQLSQQVNGGTTWREIALTGSVAAASAWVIAYSTPDFQDAYGLEPDQENGFVNGTGNDAYFLYYNGNHTNGTLIDIYGEFDTDGTGTAWEYTDDRAVRNSSILQPSDVWSDSEWTITSGASAADMTPGSHGPLPEFQGLENAFVFLGDSLSMSVTAVNTVRTDVITLSATALPAGAIFTTTTGTHTVSSTLNWNSPTAGVYSATFAAAGFAGTNTASNRITVSSTSKMDGKFYGWKNDTIVKLKNGQFWKNIDGVGTTYPGLLNPEVIVTNQFGRRRMWVDQVSENKTVVQIGITESLVTNNFTGLYSGNLYQLADGTSWVQISPDNSPASVSPDTVWRWMENGVQKMRFLDRDRIVIGTCTVKAAVAPSDTTIYSTIDGYFRGWQNKRIFALENGQFWQQTSTDNSPQTLYSPAVTITNWLQTGSWRMSVAGLPGYVTVQQLTNVTRTAIYGTFYGFGNRNIFHLADGSWWKQTSSDSSTSIRSHPEIFLWSENGTDYLELPDEGQRAAAVSLNVQFESTVTNAFTGLHYGNLYRLDGAGDWMQLSFENVPTNASPPNVMLWMDGTQLQMLVRDRRDAAIGTCVVADPSIDSDHDGASNTAEILAGFDPLDAQSRFELRQTDRYVLNWNAVEDRVYTVEWSPSLTEPFQILESQIVWPQNSWTDTIHSVETKGFYRIKVHLAE